VGSLPINRIMQTFPVLVSLVLAGSAASQQIWDIVSVGPPFPLVHIHAYDQIVANNMGSFKALQLFVSLFPYQLRHTRSDWQRGHQRQRCD